MTELLLVTQIISILTYIGVSLGLYRLLVSQKDSVIELLKSRNELLEKKVRELETQSPDALAESLSKRISIAKAEIEALTNDGQKHRAEITRKEEELSRLSTRLAELQELLKDSDLVCPECGAPMARREYFTIYGEVNGREAEADVSYVEYECGYALREDRTEPVSGCGSTQHGP